MLCPTVVVITTIEYGLQVWPIEGKKKFETLSYLPTLVDEPLVKQIEYLLRSKWIPCLEFSHVSTVKLNLPKEVGRGACMGGGD